MYNKVHCYLKTQVTTTSPADVVIMLYDGAIKCLRQAKDEIVAKNYARKGILITRALDIIAELDGCLNIEKGGELAENLHNLYFVCNTKLLRANIDLDVAMVDDVVKTLTELKSAFEEIKQQMPTEDQGSSMSAASF